MVLPLFALANAGVAISIDVLSGHEWLMAAIIVGLVVGEPVGILLAAPGAMAGIGFTMSLFIAGQAFLGASDFSAAKIAVFAASIISALVGTILLWGAPSAAAAHTGIQDTRMQGTKLE